MSSELITLAGDANGNIMNDVAGLPWEAQLAIGVCLALAGHAIGQRSGGDGTMTMWILEWVLKIAGIAIVFTVIF